MGHFTQSAFGMRLVLASPAGILCRHLVWLLVGAADRRRGIAAGVLLSQNARRYGDARHVLLRWKEAFKPALAPTTEVFAPVQITDPNPVIEASPLAPSVFVSVIVERSARREHRKARLPRPGGSGGVHPSGQVAERA
jgi:hypothetical protein